VIQSHYDPSLNWRLEDGQESEDGNDGNDACSGGAAKKYFNTAFDTAARVPIRHRLVASARRPQKAYSRAAKALVEAGAAKSMEEAVKRLQETFRLS